MFVYNIYWPCNETGELIGCPLDHLNHYSGKFRAQYQKGIIDPQPIADFATYRMNAKSNNGYRIDDEGVTKEIIGNTTEAYFHRGLGRL